jgi:hypothetical protein
MKAESSDKYGFLEGMIRIGQEQLGRQVVEALEAASWTSIKVDTADAAVMQYTGDVPCKEFRIWKGTSGKFLFIISDFEIESQSFPGQRGADGVVKTPDNTVIRLGHALSERAVQLAQKKLYSIN